jgi:hypothetical protein
MTSRFLTAASPYSGDRHVASMPAWREVVDRLGETFPRRAMPIGNDKGPDWTAHESILLHPAFDDLERMGVATEGKLSVDDRRAGLLHIRQRAGPSSAGASKPSLAPLSGRPDRMAAFRNRRNQWPDCATRPKGS